MQKQVIHWFYQKKRQRSQDMDMSYYNPRQKNLSDPRSAQINSISVFTCVWMGGEAAGVERS